jgi:hypothetical protein
LAFSGELCILQPPWTGVKEHQMAKKAQPAKAVHLNPDAKFAAIWNVYRQTGGNFTINADQL